MAKLVEVQSAKEFADTFLNDIFFKMAVARVLDAAPGFNLIRCKECACYEEQYTGYGYCYHWDYEQGMSPNSVEANDFCSYAERRNTDGKRNL